MAGMTEHTVSLTETAAKVIHEAFEAEQVDKQKSFVRVGAHPGGCSGWKFDMDFADDSQLGEADVIFESNGIKIVVEDVTLNDVLGSLEIDYKSGEVMDRGFVFKRLNEGATCGCGESFTPIKDKK